MGERVVQIARIACEREIRMVTTLLDLSRLRTGSPLRLTNVEQALAGRALNEETATMAGELAVEGAVALRQNAYKIPLMRNLVRRAIRGGPLPGTT